MPPASAQTHYAALVKALARRPGVTTEDAGAKGFGSSGQLKVDNRIFAMLVRGALVLKLPRARVDELDESRQGARFDPRRNGRLMKEWLVLSPRSKLDWLPLAQEAMTFVRASH